MAGDTSKRITAKSMQTKNISKHKNFLIPIILTALLTNICRIRWIDIANYGLFICFKAGTKELYSIGFAGVACACIE